MTSIPKVIPMSQAEYSTTIFHSLMWVCQIPKSDGAWGTTIAEKVSWTSHAILVLSRMGFPRESKLLARAIDYLKRLRREETPDWYARIPALIECNEIEWLESEGDIDRVTELLMKEEIKELFAWEAPLVLSLLKAGVDLQYQRTIDKLLSHKVKYDGLLAIGNKANYTSQTAAFLYQVDKDGHTDLIHQLTNWVLSSHIDEGDYACWERSYSITAYVIINLMDIHQLESTDKLSLIDKALRFFSPKSDGSMPTDRLTAKAHESISSIYTTIIALHAFSSVYFKPHEMSNRLVALAIERLIAPTRQKLLNGIKSFLYKKRKQLTLFGVITFTVVISLLVGYKYGFNIIVATVAGAILGALFNVLILLKWR